MRSTAGCRSSDGDFGWHIPALPVDTIDIVDTEGSSSAITSLFLIGLIASLEISFWQSQTWVHFFGGVGGRVFNRFRSYIL